jgi:hypothetical protein
MLLQVYLPEIVRNHFIDENAEEAIGTGKMWPQGTQCLVDDGDVILTMHSIPHSGSRNEWGTARMNMIWRIRYRAPFPSPHVHVHTCTGLDEMIRVSFSLRLLRLLLWCSVVRLSDTLAGRPPGCLQCKETPAQLHSQRCHRPPGSKSRHP